MLAHEWTRPHGQHAGLRPAWRVYGQRASLRPARLALQADVVTGQTSGQTTGQRDGQGYVVAV